MKKISLYLFVVLVLAACQKDTNDDWKPLDLLKYSVPITIMAPDSVAVNSQNLGGVIQDVTLKAPGYSIQIYGTDLETNDLASLKAAQLSEVKNNRYFSRIVQEEENGFLYELLIDTTFNYSFRYVLPRGDKLYTFQTGIVETYTMPEAKKLYQAVKQEE
jgi:hypothetical protein